MLLEAMLRTLVLGAGVWVWMRVVGVRHAAHERLAWLSVLVAGTLMPVAAAVAHNMWPTASGSNGLTRIVPAMPSAWSRWFWTAYLGGVVVLLVRLGLGVLTVSRLWCTAIPVPMLSQRARKVRCSPRVDAPVSIGVGILLPVEWTRWNAATCARVLTHEESHLVHRDFYWRLMAQAFTAVFWISPFSWWLSSRLSLLAEYVSDNDVVSVHGDPVEYATVLLQFAGHSPSMAMAVGMARVDLSHRIERLVLATTVATIARRPRMAVAAGLVLLLVTSAFNPWMTVASRSDTVVSSRPRLSPLAPLSAPLAPLNRQRVAQ